MASLRAKSKFGRPDIFWLIGTVINKSETKSSNPNLASQKTLCPMGTTINFITMGVSESFLFIHFVGVYHD